MSDDTTDGVKGEIDAAREEISRINGRIDGWNREVADGKADATTYVEEETKAARDKAALEMRIFELEAKLRQIEEDQITKS